MEQLYLKEWEKHVYARRYVKSIDISGEYMPPSSVQNNKPSKK
jgi:hypothetical protein